MAPRLKQVILEIHRRSLWQVLTIYIGASWFVLEVTDQVIERFLLPEWVYGGAVILLMIGLPIVLATAFVREDSASPPGSEPASASQLTEDESSAALSPGSSGLKGKLFTWPKAILGGVLAFTALGIVSAFIVLKGSARVTEAYGAAGESFGEREWIVVAEFEASEGEEDIALAAREALTIDLSQSQYVNVFGRDQVGPVLSRMELPDTTPLDRRLALEVAEREGLAAVLTGQVNRLGSDYQFIARVVQPGSGRELVGVRTAAKADRMIEGVEALSREIRGRLGEESAAIGRSRPLPEVTTRSIDALKVYARAVAIFELRDDHERAIELVKEAVALDTAFAMGYRLLSVLSNNLGRFDDSQAYAERALEHSDRLTEIERLHVEAFHQTAVTFDFRKAIDTYERILSQYPDDDRATNNIGVVAYWAGDYERSYQAYYKALSLNPNLGLAYTNTIGTAVATDRWEVADSVASLAEERGFGELVRRNRIAIAFAQGELGRAEQLCDSLLELTENAAQLAYQRQVCGTIDVARGRFDRGTDRLAAAIRHYEDLRQSWFLHHSVAALMAAEQMRGRPAAAAAALDGLLERFPADSLGEQDRFYAATGLRSYAGLLGRADLVARIDEAYPREYDVARWLADYGAMMSSTADALAAGEYDEAVALMDEGTRGAYNPAYWAPLVSLLRGFAYDGIGATDSAIAYLESGIRPGELGQWWKVPAQVHLPFVTLRLAELEGSRGNIEAAIDHYQRFLELWSEADPEVSGQVRAVERALSRLAGSERN